MQTLVLGKSSGRLIPTVGSGRYSPGPGMVKLLEEGSYQELRPRMAKCSLIPPGFLAIDSFFTTGYNYLIQIIPALIVAPRFIRGEVEFGVITQSAVAFTQ